MCSPASALPQPTHDLLSPPVAAPAPAPARGAVVKLESPVVHAKAVKNDAELRGMVEAHLRDAVALADFLSWLEDEVGGRSSRAVWGCGQSTPAPASARRRHIAHSHGHAPQIAGGRTMDEVDIDVELTARRRQQVRTALHPAAAAAAAAAATPRPQVLPSRFPARPAGCACL